MSEINYVKGDATHPIGEGRKILIHCCNDCVPGKWGAGFVMAISKRWPHVRNEYVKWSKGKMPAPPYKLGCVQFVKVENDIVIGNMLGQHGIGTQNKIPPIRYSAIAQCLDKVWRAAKSNNASVHAPKFGAGLAGGKWEIIEDIIVNSLCNRDISVTVYNL